MSNLLIGESSPEKLYKRIVSSNDPEFGLLYLDPIGFDRATFKSLYKKYGFLLKEVLHRLNRESLFESEVVDSLFKKYLDEQLVCKQLLPLFAAADATQSLSRIQPDLVEFSVAYVVAKTTALNALDTHIDLSLSYNCSTDVARECDSNVTTLICITSIFRGIQKLNACNAGKLVVDDLTSVFSHVMEIMLEDYQNRFKLVHLNSPEKRFKLYQSGTMSPFLGSGFYESTMRAALSIAEIPKTEIFNELLLKMRRLRQFVDEIADVHEDIIVGRVTYPVLIVLMQPGHRSKLVDLIREIWAITSPIICTATRNDSSTITSLHAEPKIRDKISNLYRFLDHSGAFEHCYEEADTLFREIMMLLEECFPDGKLSGLVQIITLKRAFLERLKRQDWKDTPVESISVTDLI